MVLYRLNWHHADRGLLAHCTSKTVCVRSDCVAPGLVYTVKHAAAGAPDYLTLSKKNPSDSGSQTRRDVELRVWC